MTLIYMGGNNENDRVASPENVPSHQKHEFQLMQSFLVLRQ